MLSIALYMAECLLQNNLDWYQRRLQMLSCLHGHTDIGVGFNEGGRGGGGGGGDVVSAKEMG